MSRATFRAVLAAVLGFSAAGAAAYYGWNYRTDALAAHADLLKTRGERDTLTKTFGDTKAALDVCNTKLNGESSARTGAEQNLTQAQANLAASQQELEQLRKMKTENEKRLAAFKELTDKFKKMIDTGKLTVAVRNGKMTVKLPASVLFPSGKAELTQDGQMAIMEVAVVLKEFPDRHFMVVGHTDSDPVDTKKEPQFKDNWDLSTARAVEVTEFLVKAGMHSDHLIAAGQADTDPVASNATANGKQENRRIEIVILPEVSELPELSATP